MSARRRPAINASIGQRHRLEDFQPYVKQLGEIILNGKKDVKFHRTAETREGAIRYGEKHDLHIGPADDDINNDGIPDVVLYTRDGAPVIINGWELVKSESKVREKYRTDVPDAEARARFGGFTNYKKQFYQTPNADAYIEEVQSMHDGRFRDMYGFPKRPGAARRKTLYNLFCELVVPRIQTVINTITPADKQKAKSCISAISVAAMLYVDQVLRRLWNHADNEPAKVDIVSKTDDPVERQKMFTKYLSTIPDAALRQYQSITQQIDRELNEGSIRDTLAMIGYGDETIHGLPADRPDTPEARVWRLQIKDMVARQLDGVKQFSINDVFEDGQAQPADE